MSSAPQTEVALMGMRFHVCVGILPHERELAQPLEVDLVVRHDAKSEGVVDYRELYEATRETIASDPLTYLEPLAEALATRALSFPGVTWCRVALRKPQVALGGPLAFAQVAVERTNV
jgi:dihydroneopterin aldolase/dihydroneopterin aldolase/2-amino-4-hydroxy-6-hydroxymethyldihydropteridine diphosphokinase